jgi:hypothetical protein
MCWQWRTAAENYPCACTGRDRAITWLYTCATSQKFSEVNHLLVCQSRAVRPCSLVAAESWTNTSELATVVYLGRDPVRIFIAAWANRVGDQSKQDRQRDYDDNHTLHYLAFTPHDENTRTNHPDVLGSICTFSILPRVSMQQLENQDQQISYLAEKSRTTYILKRRKSTEKCFYKKKFLIEQFYLFIFWAKTYILTIVT